jgi:2-polyprenyl-6-hydroxyphenyl methylase/3-demethylubiquinone-9 3-methyltransferase
MQYLDAEINFVRTNLTGSETVLELGAGYGRIIKELAPNCASITGIDISEESVTLGNEYLKNIPNTSLMTMDGHSIEINQYFDVVLCLQNGLSAMRATSDTINRIMGLVYCNILNITKYLDKAASVYGRRLSRPQAVGPSSRPPV